MTARGSRVAVIFVVIASLAGCAERRLTLAAPSAHLFDGPSIEIVETVSIAERHGWVAAGAGDGAGVGVLSGAGVALAGGIESGGPYGLIVGLILLPPAALIGGLYGAAAAHPAEETAMAVAAVEKVYDEIGDIAPVASRLAALTPAYTFCGDIAEPCDGGDRTRLTIDLVYSIRTDGALEPDLTITAAANAVASPADGAPEGFRWAYASEAREFFNETANDAESLRRRLAAIADQFAQAIADDLLLTPRPGVVEGVQYGEPGTGTFVARELQPGRVTRVATDDDLRRLSVAP